MTPVPAKLECAEDNCYRCIASFLGPADAVAIGATCQRLFRRQVILWLGHDRIVAADLVISLLRQPAWVARFQLASVKLTCCSDDQQPAAEL